MDYAEPLFKREEVNKAGEKLAWSIGSSKALTHAIDVIDNWRASHAYPLQVFYMRLKERACRVHPTALVEGIKGVSFVLENKPMLTLLIEAAPFYSFDSLGFHRSNKKICRET